MIFLTITVMRFDLQVKVQFSIHSVSLISADSGGVVLAQVFLSFRSQNNSIS